MNRIFECQVPGFLVEGVLPPTDLSAVGVGRTEDPQGGQRQRALFYLFLGPGHLL